jgi:hypothetical protein
MALYKTIDIETDGTSITIVIKTNGIEQTAHM